MLSRLKIPLLMKKATKIEGFIEISQSQWEMEAPDLKVVKTHFKIHRMMFLLLKLE